MDEYIKREAVEHMIEKARIISDAEGEYCGYCTDDISLYSIPNENVTLITHGKWVKKEIRGIYCFVCSQCKVDSGVNHGYNYCPSCGAKMDMEMEEEYKEEK